MKALVVAVISIWLMACAAAPQTHRLAIGHAAHEAGALRTAQEELEAGLGGANPKRYDIRPEDRRSVVAVRALAAVYWELGDADKLLALVDAQHAFLGHEPWICRVLEGRAEYREAEECYVGMGDTSRALRAVRSGAIFEPSGR